jgi:hypothetical protein
MHAPLERERAAPGRAAQKSQLEVPQNRRYRIPPDFQVFILALLPICFPLICAALSIAWGAAR